MITSTSWTIITASTTAITEPSSLSNNNLGLGFNLGLAIPLSIFAIVLIGVGAYLLYRCSWGTTDGDDIHRGCELCVSRRTLYRPSPTFVPPPPPHGSVDGHQVGQAKEVVRSVEVNRPNLFHQQPDRVRTSGRFKGFFFYVIFN